jgi:hypothetical protein
MQDFEKLGVFYLGREYDLSARKPKEQLLLYDSKDLVTHAVCVGMTGSGKTGLCLALLEEAAIDGIPAIVIDPKGDLGNLLLTFPDLKPEDFAPWINADEAAKKGLSPEDYAKAQAETWKNGLASWGEDGARIRKLKESADFAIYTPGSNAGRAVSILKSFAHPGDAIMEDPELLNDQVRTTATGLLGLVGIDADPVQSREHILISTILTTNWKQGRDVDLAGLIGQIQQPPVQRVGVIDVEAFFPQKDRFVLAMRLNNLLAAPGFEFWLAGEPLDIGAMLHTPAGKPRISIFSIAHLSDAERMFFVSLLLNQVLGWTRAQSGTTSLRALVYMDEIFGYFPPTANPPSKTPLLTLLKQARAFGVGVVLATQNPVDLDYKGLSNAGTWFIGRLQTDRDKQRVLDGLEGAASSASSNFDRSEMEQILAGLGNRIFLMNNVNDDAPVIFETRWAMSYLRGPLTRNQIKLLTNGTAPTSQATAPVTAVATAPVATTKRAAAAVAPSQRMPRPVLPPEVPQVAIPIRANPPAGASLLYKPMVYGLASVFYVDSKSGADTQRELAYLSPLPTGPADFDWNSGDETDLSESDFEDVNAVDPNSSFAPVSKSAASAKSYDAWKKSLAELIYRGAKLELFKSPTFKEMSKPGESERDFRARMQLRAREMRDAQVDRIREKYAAKVASFQERLRKAELAVQVQKEQASSSKWQTAISLGATVLGAFLGRKTFSAGTIGRATTTARGVSRSAKESADVDRAEQNTEALRQQLADIESQFKAETDAVEMRVDATTEPLETLSLRPKKTDITIRMVALAWAPHWVSGSDQIAAWE